MKVFGLAVVSARQLLTQSNSVPVTDADPAPWYVRLITNEKTADGNMKGRCGGTLVAPDLVLTAKHCHDGKSVTDLSVYCNSMNHGGTSKQIRDVVEKSAHETDDMMFLKLKHPFNLDKYCQVADLPYWPATEGEDMELVAYAPDKKSLLRTPGTFKDYIYLKNSGEFVQIVNWNAATETGDSGSGSVSKKCGKYHLLGVNSGYEIDKNGERTGRSSSADIRYRAKWIKEEWEKLSPGTYREPKDCEMAYKIKALSLTVIITSSIGLFTVLLWQLVVFFRKKNV